MNDKRNNEELERTLRDHIEQEHWRWLVRRFRSLAVWIVVGWMLIAGVIAELARFLGWAAKK